MDPASLNILQAASRVLNDEHAERSDVELLTAYAQIHIPDRLNLDADELATVVAMKLLDVPGDPENPEPEA